GQASVDAQGLAVVAEYHVRRLDITVEHAAAVRIVDRVADPEEPPEQLLELQLALAPDGSGPPGGVEPVDRLLQTVAADEPHRVVGPAVGMGAQAVHRHDTGMFQPAGDLGLDEEALAAGRVVGLAVP